MTSCKIEVSGGGSAAHEDESSDEDDVESSLQFAKCRAGLQLFREMSLTSKPPDTIRPKSEPDLGCQEDISRMSDLLSVMARMRIDDQRCALGVHSTKINQQIPESTNIQIGSSKGRSALSSKKCKDTLLELLDKRLPLQQILLTPSSQWKIHHNEVDDVSVNSLTPSLPR